jgi:hypothetical protein
MNRILAEAAQPLSPFRDDAGQVVFAAPAHIVSAARSGLALRLKR